MTFNREGEEFGQTGTVAFCGGAKLNQIRQRSKPAPPSQRGTGPELDCHFPLRLKVATRTLQAEFQATLIAELFGSRAVSLKNARGRNWTT